MTPPTTTMRRTFASPPSLLFRAWTEAPLLAQWFLPTGFSNALCEVDLRPGGHFRVHMRGPDGQIYPAAGRYLEVRKPDRIVYVDTWDDDRQDNLPVQVTLDLQDRDDGTELVLTSQFTSDAHRDKVLASGVEEGWGMFFRNLDALLPKMGCSWG